MQLQLYFAEQKAQRCCLKQINISSHHVEFSGVFLKLINIYIVTEWLVFIILQHFTQEKVKLQKKQQKKPFCKCSANRCSVKLSKIHREIHVPESHLNIVTGLQPATVLRKIPWHRCFPVITYVQVQWFLKVFHDVLIKTCE